MPSFVVQLFIRFLHNVWGSIQTPYATYRRLLKESPLQLGIIFLLIGTYFFFVSPLKLKTLHPLLLTLNTTKLFSFAITSYLGIVFALWSLGTLTGGVGRIKDIMMTWGYSLLPTLIWFFATTIFYLLLPPPRHETVPGRIFSLLFITFSITLFLWKGILYYLTLRFALRLDMKRIMLVSVIFLPTLALYSLLLYYFGVFKVPFI